MSFDEFLDKRHTSVEKFDQLLSAQVPVLLPIAGVPKTHLFIDPLKPELGLRVVADPTIEAPNTGLRHITSRVVRHDNQPCFEVAITSIALFRDAYPILCSIADRVQLGGLSPAAALRATLDRMAALLRAPDSLSREREIGLFGELLTLGGLIDRVGVGAAVRAWRGGQAEEHDFGLLAVDVEVKTTTRERRVHWIESLTQLVPTGRRSLWLVSHQITGAGVGAGHTLGGLINELRQRIGTGAAADAFERGLGGSSWDDSYRERITSRWTRRTASEAHYVGDRFPRITPDALRHANVELDRVPEVRYRVELDGLATSDDVPEDIAHTLDFRGWT